MTQEINKTDVGKENEREVQKAGTGRSANALWHVIQSVFYYAAGFFFCMAKLPFDARGLGLALLCGVSRGAVPVTLGIITRAAAEYIHSPDLSFLLTAGSAAFACAVRYIFNVLFLTEKQRIHLPVLQDSMPSRALLAGITMLLARAVPFFFGTPLEAGEILSAAFAIVAAAGFSYLYCFFFDKIYRYTTFFDAGLGALLFTAVLSLKGIEAAGISVALVFGFAATLYIGYCGEASRGCAMGLLVGLAVGGIYIPLFAVAGLAAGIFYRVGIVSGSLLSLGIFLCGGVLSTGTESVLSYLPGAGIGTVLVALPALFGILPEKRLFGGEAERETALSLVEEHKAQESFQRLNELSCALASLSPLLTHITESFSLPDRGVAEQMIRSVWNRHCATCREDCSSLLLCGGEDRFFTRFAERLMQSGRLTVDEIESLVVSDCPKIETITEEMNACAATLIGTALARDRKALLSADYHTTSQMLSDALVYSSSAFTPDRVLTDKLRRTLLAVGVAPENAAVCGDRKKYIVVCGGELVHAPVGTDTIRELCEKVCDCALSDPVFRFEGQEAAITMEGLPRYEIECVTKQQPKEGETCLGDSVSVLRNGDGYFYAFLCDGMGSGKEAALTAGICRVFLEKMLAVGNKKTTTLEMLNRMILNKGTECFATVDLLEIDLMLGTASFVKSGATPSYVIRDRHLFKITGTTAPIGILPNMQAEMTEFDLRDGDVIVLSSDGISCDETLMHEDDTPWFAELLGEEDAGDLNTLAEKIMEGAERQGGKRDDRTLELVRITKAKNRRESQPSSGEPDEGSVA